MVGEVINDIKEVICEQGQIFLDGIPLKFTNESELVASAKEHGYFLCDCGHDCCPCNSQCKSGK